MSQVQLGRCSLHPGCCQNPLQQCSQALPEAWHPGLQGPGYLMPSSLSLQGSERPCGKALNEQ